jgi:cytoskeletal protein RodZ
VGEALLRERTRCQLTLEDVSAATRISVRFLKAIEAEDFGQLPGVMFARSFVRQYAEFLNLDPGPFVAALPRVDLDSAPMPQAPARPRRSAWDPRWNSTFASITWTLLAGGAAVGAYVHYNRALHTGTAQSSPSALATVHAARPAPAPQTAPAPPAPAPVTPVSDQKPSEPASPAHPVEVAIKATEDAWVQATADGKPLFATTLKAGEVRPISADDWVKIRTGNAGGIEISLNGKTIDRLGPQGQIRTVTLTAEGPRLAPVAPAPQNPPPATSPL